MRGIMLKNTGLAQLWPGIWPILALLATAIAVALSFYRKTLDGRQAAPVYRTSLPSDIATSSPSSSGRHASGVSGTLATRIISWKPGATVTPLA